jgi:hypothetical protein
VLSESLDIGSTFYVGRPASARSNINAGRRRRHTPCSASWCVLFGYLLRRFFVQHAQTSIWKVALVRLMIGLLMGAAWFGQAVEPTNEAIPPTQGALFALALSALLDTTFQTATVLPQIYPLLSREWANGYYPVSSMLAALLVCHMLLHSVHIVLVAVPVFLLAGLRGSFLWFLAPLLLLGWLGVALVRQTEHATARAFCCSICSIQTR